MNPRDFLDTAQQLANGTTAADLRSAISRAYYAAFLVGLEKLTNLNSAWSRLDHGKVVQYLSNSRHPDVEMAGTYLGQLQSERVKADYRMNDPKPENKNNARLWISQTHNIINLLDQHCRGSAIADAIKQHERNTGQAI